VEAGTVRLKNTRSIMVKNVLDTCVCAIAFWCFGYAFGFGYGSRFIGWKFDTGKEAFLGARDQVDVFFQFSFAATSATIIAGAVAERTQLLAYLVYR
jgi:Amt family ammonium transporter